jgi:ATP-binding cassette subfamily C protein
VLIMMAGRQQAFGPKEQVFQPPQQQPQPAQQVAQAAGQPAARLVTPMTVHASARPAQEAKS